MTELLRDWVLGLAGTAAFCAVATKIGRAHV